MRRIHIPEHEKQHAPLGRSFERLLTPFEAFVNSQSSSGILLLLSALAALFLANSQWQPEYFAFGHLELSIGLGEQEFSHSVHHWVNDGLMAIFFFLLGLEIKREVLAGDLKHIRQSTLVLFMALGGMILPALIFAAISQENPDLKGWGIPMATDTAFALGALALLGKAAPRSTAVLLSALAIVDDIGAVLVISIFYTEHINLLPLLYAGIALISLFSFNLLGIRSWHFYILGGVALWWFILHSGVHTTTAGILAAMCVPARPYAESSWFKRRLHTLLARFEKLDKSDKSILEKNRQHDIVEQMQEAASKATTPLQHWTTVLDKPVCFTIIPLFAFLNAGVELPKDFSNTASSAVTLGSFTGLVLGKAVGISLFAWVSVKLKFASMPTDLHFRHIIALSLVAGMGFTMSLFIATLAYQSHPGLLADAKVGILSGSLVAGVCGYLLFLYIYKQSQTDPKHAKAPGASGS
ncbi:Na(+)/H(+) antiporter NhaA [Thalassocella blandensis]|nr:Na(+)/H(+) antiporter NhaA [Thalassocella blandensis]